MQLRELAEAERGRARERILADIRGRIAAVLTEEQKPRYAAMTAEAASRTVSRGRIYLMGQDGRPKAFNVRLGITDGSSTELLLASGAPEAEELKEGAAIIIGVATPQARPTGTRPPTGGPRLMF